MEVSFIDKQRFKKEEEKKNQKETVEISVNEGLKNMTLTRHTEFLGKT